MIGDTTSFINRAIVIHGSLYDYRESIYTKATDKLKIKCNKCTNTFEQTPHGHLKGQGCPFCNKMRRMDIDSFIYKAKKIHGDNYSYENTIYTKSSEKVKILCNKCNTFFEVVAHHHLQGKGCLPCRGKISTKSELLHKLSLINDNEFEYEIPDYFTLKDKMNIICNKHEHPYIFSQMIIEHLSGAGCPKCKGRYKTNEDIIKDFRLIHGDLYDYSNVVYVNSKSKIKIKCKIHGEFEQKPNCHLSGQGCHICKESRGERMIRNILVENNIQHTQQHRIKSNISGRYLWFDFEITVNGIKSLIEYNGVQHYRLTKFGSSSHQRSIEKFTSGFKNDLMKYNYCTSNNIPLLIIPYINGKNIKNIIEAHISRLKNYNNMSEYINAQSIEIEKYRQIKSISQDRCIPINEVAVDWIKKYAKSFREAWEAKEKGP